MRSRLTTGAVPGSQVPGCLQTVGLGNSQVCRHHWSHVTSFPLMDHVIAEPATDCKTRL
jgi:hypothetical protein